MSWINGMRTRLRLFFSRRAAESRIDEEFRLHIEMETQQLVGEAGLDPQEARRRALVSFGGVEKHREALRDGRGLAWLAGMWLDMKLGLRILVKYPGLSLVGVLGMAAAVAICAVSFGVIQTVLYPTLPLDEGNRVVAIQNLDSRTNDEAPRTHLPDLIASPGALPAVESLGGYRTIDRNLITFQGRPESVRITEMTASGFKLTRVPPLLGRYFHEEDELGGAPAVVVIGYDMWESRFAREPDVVGRTLQLGAMPYTIVGVMPKGFAFPVNNRLWTPLRLNPSNFERGRAPPIKVFGRLAPNATLDDAETQLRTLSQRLATEYPATHQFIRARIVPYPRAFLDSAELAWTFNLVPILVSMLLVAIATNVAILVYARTSTRMGEIAVRSALGATRARVVTQISTEALLLSASPALLGLAVAWFALQQIEAFLSQTSQLPFWMCFGISPGMILYVTALAALGTVVVGVIPALRATRQHANLQQLGVGRSGMRLGRTWTMLIVAQVAVCSTVLPFAVSGVDLWIRYRMAGPGFAAEEFLTARLYLDRQGAASEDPEKLQREFATHYANLQAELIRRLKAEPGIDDVVLASALPSQHFEGDILIEVDRAAGAGRRDIVGSGSANHRVAVSWVNSGFFPAFDIPVLTGRGFQAVDDPSNTSAVIVNRSFVQLLRGGGEVLGRRVRLAVSSGEAGPESVQAGTWHEIVGVVPDFPTPVKPKVLEPRLYHALLPGVTRPVFLILRLKGTPAGTFTARLRELTVAADPLLRIESVGPLDDSLGQDAADQVLALLVAIVSLSFLLLSAAGIYALMSYTITMRRREIGIRSALGAGPATLIRSIPSRAAARISSGIALGTALTGLAAQAMISEGLDGREIILLVVAAALMIGVGILAAAVPARRALRVQPTEALRGE